MEAATVEPDPGVPGEEEPAPKRHAVLVDALSSAAYEVDIDTGGATADVTSAGIEGFRFAARAVTTVERRAAGAVGDGFRGLTVVADTVLDTAGRALDAVVDSARSGANSVPGANGILDTAGGVANVAGRMLTRAANAVTSTAGSMDAAQLASLPGALAETAGGALNAVSRSAGAVEPLLSAGHAAGNTAIHLASQGVNLAGDAAGLAASVASTIDIGAALHVAGEVAGAAGEVGVHIVEAIADGLSGFS